MTTGHAEQHCPEQLEQDGNHAARRPSPIDRQIGDTMRRMRQDRGLTQQQMATRCHLSTQQIQKYEAGTNRIPASRLFDIASVLGTRPTALLTEAWSGEMQDETEALNTRLAKAASLLETEALRSVVDIAEQLARPR